MFNSSPFPGMNTFSFFDLFPFFFVIVFIIVIGTFIFAAIKGFSTWNKNNHSPILRIPAVIVAKRGHTSHHHHNHHHGEMHHSSSSTSYYATFEFDNGERLELNVPTGEFGYMAEGDKGNLTFQGTRFKSFERFKQE